jgi:hypothetical protein
MEIVKEDEVAEAGWMMACEEMEIRMFGRGIRAGEEMTY